MKLKLDLTRHCIETEIRRQHHRAVAACLRKNADIDALSAAVELTRRCLEELDFAALRSAHPALAGGSGADVWIAADEGPIRVWIDGAPVPPS